MIFYIPYTLVCKIKTISNFFLIILKQGDYSILSNPEFLSEGNAIKNLLEPDRVVIGGDKETGKILGKLYENWVDQEKLLYTSIESAELGKLLSNAMLAQRVASINTISRVCEETGSNIKEIQKIVGSDRR